MTRLLVLLAVVYFLFGMGVTLGRFAGLWFDRRNDAGEHPLWVGFAMLVGSWDWPAFVFRAARRRVRLLLVLALGLVVGTAGAQDRIFSTVAEAEACRRCYADAINSGLPVDCERVCTPTAPICCTEIGPDNPTGCDKPCSDDWHREIDLRDTVGSRVTRGPVHIPKHAYRCRETEREWICEPTIACPPDTNCPPTTKGEP